MITHSARFTAPQSVASPHDGSAGHESEAQNLHVQPAIVGVGVFIPPYRVSNEALVNSFNAYVRDENQRRARDGLPGLSEASAEVIEKATGIRARYFLDGKGIVDPTVMRLRLESRGAAELSVQAEFAVSSARQAIRNAGLQSRDIDLVICSCTHFHRAYPALAIEIQKALGCTGAAFDMNTACSSTVFAIHIAANLVRAGAAQNVLICSPEIMSAQLDFRDRNTHFMFGDASVAVVVSGCKRVMTSTALLGPAFEIAKSEIWTSFSNAVRSDLGMLSRADRGATDTVRQFVDGSGNKAFKDLTVAAGRRVRWFLSDAGIQTREIDYYWLQQTSARQIEALMRYIDPELGDERAPVILDEIGDVGAAGPIIAFERSMDRVQIQGLGVMSSFGAGYGVGSLLLRRIS